MKSKSGAFAEIQNIAENLRISTMSFVSQVLRCNPTDLEVRSVENIANRKLGEAVGMERAIKIMSQRVRDLDEEEQQ